MTTVDPIWRTIVAAIPSRHITPAMCDTAFGARRSLMTYAARHPRYPPLRYLEIGCRMGHSLAAVLLSNHTATAVVIDAWIPDYAGEPNTKQLTIDRLHSLGIDVTNRVRFIDGSSRDILSRVPSSLLDDGDGTFDLILVDGDHTPDGARFDLLNTLPRLAVNGLLVFDDAIDGLERVCVKAVDDVTTSFRTMFDTAGYAVTLCHDGVGVPWAEIRWR